MSNLKPTMLLITAELKEGNSFKLIPIDKDCPYSEGIFDNNTKVLAMMGNLSKNSLHLVPKLTEQGDILPVKKPRAHGQPYQEKQITLDTFVEYYVSIPKEIATIIDMVAVNASTFDYKQYLKPNPELPPMKMEAMPGGKAKETPKKEVKKPQPKK